MSVTIKMSNQDSTFPELVRLILIHYYSNKQHKLIAVSEAQDAPELFFEGLSPTSTYMVVSLDIDAPFPSFNVLGPILHWIQPGLQPERSESNSNSFTLKTTAPFVANYIGPAPPPGSSPHRYTFFLYEQPDAFDGAKYAPPDGQTLGNMSRMRYDLDAWGKEIGLGSLVAMNYFNSN